MEKQLVSWLKNRFGARRYSTIGIGDDCAVLPGGDSDLVVTCDAICEGVHFQSSLLSPEQIGRKALAVNLSDLASMGAKPFAALVSLTIPRSASMENVQRLFMGMERLAEQSETEICGGDTTVWDGELVVSLTALGLAPSHGAWTISGARPGDRILVTGSFGGSIVSHHWAFEPHIPFAVQFRNRQLINACTDASDSLGIDLAKIATASGTGFTIQSDRIPVSTDAVELARTSGLSPVEHALSDGEDFELILAVNPDAVQELQSDCPGLLTDIGFFTEETSFVEVTGDCLRPFVPKGYEHCLDRKNA